MLQLIPRGLHRLALQAVYRLRHRWRLWRKTPLEGVSIILQDSAGAILLVRHSYGPQNWMLPGGGLKTGENPVEAIRREMREEMAAEITELQCLGSFPEVLSGSPSTEHVFFGKFDGAPTPDRREVMEARYFPLDALPQPLSALSRSKIENWRALRG